jgi:hypothetical protein
LNPASRSSVQVENGGEKGFKSLSKCLKLKSAFFVSSSGGFLKEFYDCKLKHYEWRWLPALNKGLVLLQS